VGGAAINRRFGWRILYTEDGALYTPGVFYCKDAFEGLATMDALGDPRQREALLNQLYAEAARELGQAARPKPARAEKSRSRVVPSL